MITFATAAIARSTVDAAAHRFAGIESNITLTRSVAVADVGPEAATSINSRRSSSSVHVRRQADFSAEEQKEQDAAAHDRG